MERAAWPYSCEQNTNNGRPTMQGTSRRQGLSNYKPVLEAMRDCDQALADLADAHAYRSGIYSFAVQLRAGLGELAQLLPGRGAHGYFQAPDEQAGHSTPEDRV